MKTEPAIFLLFLLFIALIGGIYGFAKYKESKHYFIYHGTNGDYRIDIQTIGNQTDYYLYAVSQNKLYLTPLRKKPQDVEPIPLEKNLLGKLQNSEGPKTVYITQDYSTPLKTGQLSIINFNELGKILGKAEYGIYKLDVHGAFTDSTNRSRELEIPQIDCANTTSKTAVIYLKLGEQNRVYSSDDCIIVEGKDTEGLTLATNKFAYYLLGVF